jgi:aminopeptidase N
MATSEMHVTVRDPYMVIANGALENVEPGPSDGSKTYHFHQDVPHVSYLTSIVAGQFSEIKDEWDGIPILYYVPVGREEDGREIFKNTPDMMKLFSEKTGVRYPYAKYSQVIVQDFIFGGMENVSATTLTDSALYDARARIDADADYVIAHEIAHQWFGNKAIPATDEDDWVSETLAEYWAGLAMGAMAGGKTDIKGFQKMLWDWRGEAGNCEATGPITSVNFTGGEQWFRDRYCLLYHRGPLVVHMLRTLIGDERFAASSKLFLDRAALGPATTDDFEKML